MTDKEVRTVICENPGLGRRELSKKYPDVGEGVFRRILKEIQEEVRVEDIDDEALLKLQKQKQNAMDRARIANRMVRESVRVTNVIEELNDKFIELFSDIELPVKIEQHKTNPYSDPCSVIVTLADLHAQEVIEEDFNQYSPEILGKRLRKLAVKTLEIAKFKEADEIVVVGLGDLINSDRRKSEIMVNAVNRTRASIMVATLLEQFILDLYSSFPVRVAFVYGNESRVDKEHGREDALISDNFDFSIYNMLKMMFKNTDVVFEDGRGTDQVISVYDKNVLITHGDSSGFKQDPSKGIIFKRAQYADMGILVDYILFGHLHGCYIHDLFARSGSMCGGNAFSQGLGFTSRASQNVVCVGQAIEAMRIDLQDALTYNGYKVDPNILGYVVK